MIAHTGERALEHLDSSTGIDLVLMHIDLGSGIDGIQTAEAILARHAMPIIFLSSHTASEVSKRTETITTNGHVLKSASIGVLLSSINVALSLFEANRSKQKMKKYEYLP